MESDLIRLGGLWLNQGKASQYLSGNLSATAKILVFKNKKKQSEKDPDYIMYLAPAKKREETSGAPRHRELSADETEAAYF